ncbi:MAG: alcohol dehydrogenase catalytic domain-containing protein [Polaromonas sp.]
MFKALLLTKNLDGATLAEIASLDEAQLPEGEVLVNVAYSTVNYKDALAITGKSPVVRKFPMVPGIDFAGTVAESSDARYKPGDAVLLNRWGVGETHWGGLAQGMDLQTTLAPFILRGVTLAGIDGVYAPQARRLLAWERLARELPAELLEANTETFSLNAVIALAPRLLAGQVRGRVRVDLAA